MSERPRAPRGLAVTPFQLGRDEYVLLSYPLPGADLFAQLTEAERRIASAVLQGRSTAEIARATGRSRRTIANQLASMYRKLGVRSRAELAALILRTVVP